MYIKLRNPLYPLKYESRDAGKSDVVDEILHKRRNQMTVP